MESPESIVKVMEDFVVKDSPTVAIMEIKLLILETTIESMRKRFDLAKPLMEKSEQKACVPCPQCGENEINKLPFDNRLSSRDHEDVMTEWVTCLSCKNRYQPGVVQRRRQNALNN